MSVLVDKIVINDFKKLSPGSYKFERGLNTIFGPNFSGKTTLLEAILYALYGSSAVSGTSDTLPNADGGSKTPSVRLYLTNGYEVDRRGGSVSLYKDGAPVSRSSSVVVKDLEEMSMLTKSEALKTRVSKQGEAHSLLSTGSSELKKLVEDLSGCTVVDQVLSRSKALASSGEAKALAVKEIYIGDKALKDLRSERDSLASLLEGKQAELKATTERVKLANAELDKAKQELKEGVEFNAKQMAIVNEVSNLEARLESLDKSQALLDKPLSEEERESLESELSHLTGILKTRKELVMAKSSNEDALNKARRTLNKAKAELSDYPLPSTSSEDLKQDVFERSSYVERDEATLKKLRAQLKDGVCSECKRPFEEHFDKGAVEAEIAELEEEVSRQGAKLSDLQKEYKQVIILENLRRSAVSLVEHVESDVKALEEEAEKLPDSLEVLSKQQDEAQDQVSAIKFKLEADMDAAEKYRRSKELRESMQERLKACADRLEPDRDLSTMREMVEDLSKQTGKLGLLGHELQLWVNGAEPQISNLKQRIVGMEQLQQSLKDAEESSALYKELTKHITKNRAQLMAAVWDGILQEATTFVSDVTDSYVSEVSVDDKFSIQYKEKGHTFPIASASGSQKSLISTGIRLGIANMLPSNFGFILMDEVTADMEEEISVAAMNLAKLRVPQIISVSHRPSDMQASDSLIELSR